MIPIPALIDPHVHFRTPGAEHKENWISGARAAVAGGVGMVFDMPNNFPACITLADVKNKKTLINRMLADANIPLKYHLYFGATPDNIREIPKIKDHVIGIKLFMGSSTGNLLVDRPKVQAEIFKMAADMDMLVSVHAEAECCLLEGFDHVLSRPKKAAIEATERAIGMAEKYQTRLCILHVSTKEEIALIRRAKREGVRVFAEVAPHHLLLTNNDYARLGSLVQVNPPLREKEDQEALWQAIDDGTIDFLGSDHAPHTLEEKAHKYPKSPSGIPSIELTLGLMLNAVSEHRLTLKQLVQLTRTNIEKIFRLAPSDDTVWVDLEHRHVIDDHTLQTKCGWSPYRGKKVTGCLVASFLESKPKGIYQIDQSYTDNIKHGPVFSAETPKRPLPPPSDWISFLDFRLSSPLGIPAGPLLDSRWTSLAANMGFDVVTYKTIRSQAHPSHPLPNIVFVKPLEQKDCALQTDECKPLSITNSFGMPSMPPEYLQTDIAHARAALQPGQILIVSVVGTAGYAKTVTDDFVKTARMAKEAGAHAIEANFSCPNITAQEGSLYHDPETCYEVASVLVKALGQTPLIIKIGTYRSAQDLRQVLHALARAGARAVCGINSVSMSVMNAIGQPALGPMRKASGVCGDMIRSHALEFIRQAHNIIDGEKLGMQLMGCGGVTKPLHFDEFLQAGANVAMTATGFMWDPYIAMKWHGVRYAHHH